MDKELIYLEIEKQEFIDSLGRMLALAELEDSNQEKFKRRGKGIANLIISRYKM